MDVFVASIEIDPDFTRFVRLCERRGHSLSVVSDGLDRTVGSVLRRHGLHVPFYANHLEWRGDNRWRLAFPHARSDCRALAGTCKCHLAGAPYELSILVGDGRSDFCVAANADLILAKDGAKDGLLDHCMASHLTHLAFSDFGQACRLLTGWLDSQISSDRHQQAPGAGDRA
jgi:2-hydroxy-3-keto-5-methylthiopentenyl-1-phosphate phosphatase